MPAGRKPAHLSRGPLDHGLPKRDLPISSDDNLAAFFNTDDGRTVPAGEVLIGHVSLRIVLRRYMDVAGLGYKCGAC